MRHTSQTVEVVLQSGTPSCSTWAHSPREHSSRRGAVPMTPASQHDGARSHRELGSSVSRAWDLYLQQCRCPWLRPLQPPPAVLVPTNLTAPDWQRHSSSQLPLIFPYSDRAHEPDDSRQIKATCNWVFQVAMPETTATQAQKSHQQPWKHKQQRVHRGKPLTEGEGEKCRCTYITRRKLR